MSDNNIINDNSGDDFIRIQDLWKMFIPKWHWFAVSIIVTLSIAAFYLLSTPAIYTRTASILIKDENKGGATSSAMNEFADLGIFNSNTNINNELLTLKSPTLMTEVVHRLKLNEKYIKRNGLKNIELYKCSPIELIFVNNFETGISFKVTFKDLHHVSLTEFTYKGDDIDGIAEGKLGDTLNTPVGNIYIIATPSMDEEFVGTTIRYSKSSVASMADFYSTNLRAELGHKEATIINLSLNEASTLKAEDILNTLIEIYNEYWIMDKNQIAISTSQFISDRLGVIENELGHVDENISNYKSQHLLPDVQAASNLYMNQSAENKKELVQLNTQLSTAKYIRKELNNKSLVQPLSGNSGIANNNIENQISEYNRMVIDRNRLIANSSEKNPLVIDLANSLQSMQKGIVQSIDNLIVSLNTQIASIQKQESITTDQLASSPNQAKYLLSVERQQKVKEQLYLYLLQKREENELSQAFTAYNTRIITAPRGSIFPTAPKKSFILLAAFIIGLLIPAAVIFIKETMNTTIKSKKDLENLTIPFIGEIPLFCTYKKNLLIKKKILPVKSFVIKAGNRNVINEAFRVLRTNIDFMTNKDQNQKVIMITSLIPGSGKSFIAMNLAMSFAIKKKKIIVIDGDLRRATSSSYMNSPKIGLSDYLADKVENYKSLIIKHEKYPDLNVIPVGSIPPNPTELLEDDKMPLLIEELKKEYDYVFIDCPPINMMADAQIISKLADRTLFIVRAGFLERAMLPEIDNIYKNKHYNNMALVLNGVETAGGRYGKKYGYGYRYGYGYGYGYGYDKKQ